MTKGQIESQLRKYKEWTDEVHRRQAELAKWRRAYMRCFAALPFVSLLGFLWNVGVGAGALFTALLMALFGVYTVNVRETDYDVSLRESRRELARLRGLQSAVPPA